MSVSNNDDFTKIKFLLEDRNIITLKKILSSNVNLPLYDISINACEKNISELNERLLYVESQLDYKYYTDNMLISYVLGNLTGLSVLFLVPIFEKFLK